MKSLLRFACYTDYFGCGIKNEFMRTKLRMEKQLWKHCSGPQEPWLKRSHRSGYIQEYTVFKKYLKANSRNICKAKQTELND